MTSYCAEIQEDEVVELMDYMDNKGGYLSLYEDYSDDDWDFNILSKDIIEDSISQFNERNKNEQ